MDVIDTVHADELEPGDNINTEASGVEEIKEIEDDGLCVTVFFGDGEYAEFSPHEMVDIFGYSYDEDI